jgi:hypothetical protein
MRLLAEGEMPMAPSLLALGATNARALSRAFASAAATR